MADQTIELVSKRAKEKMKVQNFETKQDLWNSTCDELHQEMTKEGLTNTAQAILSLKVNH